jgi:RimJ/RimL family protein N-acetyltransferase
MWADPEVMRFMGEPATRENTWARVLRYIGHWTAFGHGMWAVRDHENRFCGDVGIFDSRRDLDPQLTAPEVGWVLATWAQGRGFATEALTAAIDWFERTHGRRELWCMVDPDNAPSLRVAAKQGFVETDRPLYHGEQVVVLTRPSTPGRASRATT